MERTPIKNLTPGREVKIQGFVEKIRDTRAMAFLVVRDRSGKVQVTLDKTNPAFAQLLAELTAESVVTVEGYVAGNKNVKLNGIELLPEVLRVESVAAPIPLTKDSAIDVKLDYRWLCFRGEREQLLFRAQTLMAAAMRSFLLARGFVEIHTPKLIGAASESGADVFEVGYFGRKAYLAQSPQFYKQMAMAGGLERVFEVGPVFRAEKSYTSRHTTEFTGFDLEFSYIESFRDVMRLEAELLAHALGEVRAQYGEEIARLYDVEVVVPALPFIIFFISGITAGFAGILCGMKYAVIPTLGSTPALKAFIASVVGGLGSLPGAVVGGLILGVLETLTSGFVSSVYRDLISYGVLIIAMMFLPHGLLGRSHTDKL